MTGWPPGSSRIGITRSARMGAARRWGCRISVWGKDFDYPPTPFSYFDFPFSSFCFLPPLPFFSSFLFFLPLPPSQTDVYSRSRQHGHHLLVQPGRHRPGPRGRGQFHHRHGAASEFLARRMNQGSSASGWLFGFGEGVVWTLRLDRCMHAIFFSLRGNGWGGGPVLVSFLFFLSRPFSWIALGCAAIKEILLLFFLVGANKGLNSDRSFPRLGLNR